MDSRTLLRHSQDPTPRAQGGLSCPWLSPCPGTPEPAPLAEHPTRFAQLLTPDPPRTTPAGSAVPGWPRDRSAVPVESDSREGRARENR